MSGTDCVCVRVYLICDAKQLALFKGACDRSDLLFEPTRSVPVGRPPVVRGLE